MTLRDRAGRACATTVLVLLLAAACGGGAAPVDGTTAQVQDGAWRYRLFERPNGLTYMTGRRRWGELLCGEGHHSSACLPPGMQLVIYRARLFGHDEQGRPRVIRFRSAAALWDWVYRRGLGLERAKTTRALSRGRSAPAPSWVRDLDRAIASDAPSRAALGVAVPSAR